MVIRSLVQLSVCAFLIGGLVPGSAAEIWTLGAWNLENLSPTAKRGFPELQGNNQYGPRSPNQLKQVAKYIRDDLGVDALMLSEIYVTHDDNGSPRSSQLDKIIDEMGSNWEYSMGSSAGKNLCFLYNTDRVSVAVIGEFSVEEFTVQEKDIYDRDPLVAWIDVLDEDGEAVDNLLLVGLHLKSQQKHRDNHLVAVAKLITELDTFKEAQGIADSEEDVIIMGDLNDSSHKRNGFTYLFDYLDDKGYVHLRNDSGQYPGTRINGSEIDHILLDGDLEYDWIDPSSFQVHSATNPTQYRKTYSDHYPLTFEFEVVDDDD